MSKYLLFISAIIWFFISCSEIPPDVVPDSDITRNERKVLVEEFTGVFCQNCPAGSQFLESLKENYEDKLVIVSIHAGFFARTYNESKHDFKTDESEALQNFLGAPVAYPSATINRILPTGTDSRALSQNEWAIIIEEQLKTETPIDIILNLTWNNELRKLKILTITRTSENIESPLFVTVFLIEDRIIDPQNSPEGVVLDYMHNHVLRDVMTPVSGLLLANNWVTNQSEQKEFQVQIPHLWVETNLSVVVAIHENGETLNVWQVASKKIIE